MEREFNAVAERVGTAAQGRAFLSVDGEMAAVMRAVDWASTPLGPVATWSPALRMMVGFMHANRFPLLLWWGPQYVSIYNEAYRPILGGKHPWAMGQPVSACWSEIWHILQPLIDTPFYGGAATWMEDILLEINRHGFVEETHFTIAYSPVPDETAPRGIGGVLATVHEITEKVVGERRIAILRDLGARATEAKTVEEACTTAAETLARHPKDIPFALVYLVDSDGKHARLAGAAGIGADDSVGPVRVALGGDGIQAEPWPLARSMETESIQTVEALGERLATVPAGPWPDPPHTAVVAPISSNMPHQPAGFLVAGISPRLKFNESYRSFIGLMTTQIGTAIANARAHEEVRKRAEALAEIDRAKTTFFSNVSHEFRTPLTLMLGTLDQSLAAADLTAPRRDELTIAHRNSLRLLRMVNTLLDFSRVEAGRIEASYEPVDLAGLTTELASNFRSACERAGLRYEVECEALPEPAYVDREMWEKIVLNLVSNAFKFTLQGAIHVRLTASDNQARLAVSDTGTGIPDGHLPRVFDRFHRVPDSRGRTHEGTGIGLALVQELVKLHGGDVAVESEEGRGSTFTVSIPLGSAHLPSERIGAARNLSPTSIRAQAFVDEALRWLPEGAAARDLPSVDRDLGTGMPRVVEPRRVLVVDDNADMRDYLARLLRPFHEVDTARDGLEALGSMIARRPDLVVSDVMMPGLDGFGLLRAVRADPSLRDIPVIVLSARAGEEAQIEGLAAGADDYLVKPFSARELLACVDNSLRLAQFRRETNAELAASEARHRALVNASSDVVYRMSPDWSEMRHLVGRDFIEDTEAPSQSWLNKYIHPDDQQRVMAAINEAIRTKSAFELEHRVRRVDGTLGWTFSRAVSLLDAEGHITEWIGMASDVTQRKLAETRQKLLVDELNHRVKNTLASVQSIAMQTARGASTIDDYHDAFMARLAALSRAHDLLTLGNWQAASLMEIVRGALEPYGAAQDRIAVEGPAVRLTPSAALTLNMALHELATNAAKYGALSVPMGRIMLDWRVDGDGAAPTLCLQWAERGGPPVSPPRRRGFGSRLIERGIAQDLDGEVRLDFDRQGVQCLIRLPMTERIVLP